MKYFCAIVLLVFLSCCKNGRNVTDERIEIVPIYTENITDNVSDFIERMEAVPLESRDTASLMKGYRKLIYDPDSDLYAILDNRFVILLFSGDGRFVSSSETKQGNGPDQYQMVVDIKFNPFDKGIDLLNPYGVVYTYDYSFNLIRKTDFEQTGLSFSNLMAYGKQKYLFTPSLLVNDNAIYWFDYELGEQKKANYQGTLSSINMDREAFYKIDSVYYFIPTGINYYFYQIDMGMHRLTPYMKLDFGNEEIEEDELPGKVKANLKTLKSSEKQTKFIHQLRERNNYLERSSHLLPLIKFFNDKYVYVHYIKDRQPSNYIYNRQTKEGFLQHGTKPLKMPFCFSLDDTTLYAIVDAYEIEEYINKDLIAEDIIEKLENVKEDDNPIILKYYLK